jgi:putative ABC transport system substrate-binding protein
MPSRGVAWTLPALLAAVTCLGAVPTRAGTGPVVVIVKSSSIPPFEQAAAAIVETLRHGTPQPEIVTFDLEGAEANASSVLPQVHRVNPTLVVPVGSLATATVLDDPTRFPVVFTMVLYPKQSGFVTRDAHAVTGASLDVPLGLQFEMVHRLLPDAHRVGVLYHPGETGRIIELARGEALAHPLTLEAMQVDAPEAVLGVLGNLMERVDVVWTVADSHVFTPQTTSALVLAALRRRMPLIGLSTLHVRTGALAALYSDYADVGAQAGELALRVLRGENPADIPVTFPRKTAVALNLRTAQHLNVRVAADLEQQATEVVR